MTSIPKLIIIFFLLLIVILSLPTYSVAVVNCNSVFVTAKDDAAKIEIEKTCSGFICTPSDKNIADIYKYTCTKSKTTPKFEKNIYKNVKLEQEISKIYNWGIGLVGVLAFVMIIYGGILYMVSGVVDQKSKAKGIIQDALIGLFLALLSFLIIGGINEKLTIITPPKLVPVEIIAPEEAPEEEKEYISTGTGEQCLTYPQLQSLADQGYTCGAVTVGDLDCPKDINNPQGSFICTPPEE